jgi:hypothetical protein
MGGPTGWYLKKESGEIYGPVAMNELALWAVDGRVDPSDAISPDGQSWTPAPDNPALEMCWMVEVEPGTFYGPAHAGAFADLMRTGDLPGASRVRHARTGEETTLILLAARHEAVAAAAARVSQAEPDSSPAAAPPERTVSWQNIAHEKDRFEREAGKWKALYEEERARGMNMERRLEETIRAGEKDRIERDSAIDHAAREIEALHRQIQTARDGDAGPAGGLAATHADLCRTYDTLASEMTRKNEELESARAQEMETRRVYEERLRLAEQQLQAERAATDGMRKRLGEVEHAHAEVVRSFRDLNDRYIRLREQMTATAAPGPESGAKIRMNRNP